MIRALYSAATGMTAQQMNVDNIANNLANSNTAGFKARRQQFSDLLYQTVVQPGAAAGSQTTVPTGLQLGLGTRATSNEIVFTQGSFTQTSNPLDLVIQGNGFFQVRMANGNLVEPAITLPPNAQNVTIATDGTVSYTVPNQTASQTAGQIQLATFINPAGMNSLGQNLYAPTNASGEPIVGNPGGQEGLGTLLQGYTEQSNVSVVDEFVNLIVSQRAYEANSKVIKAADEMYQGMNNLTR
jgi:flagellar basal-body rod protein FlgG